MSKKTTKTAHVMSILTKNGVTDNTDEQQNELIDTVEEEFSEQDTDNKISQAVQSGLLELLDSESSSLTPDITSKESTAKKPSPAASGAKDESPTTANDTINPSPTFDNINSNIKNSGGATTSTPSSFGGSVPSPAQKGSANINISNLPPKIIDTLKPPLDNSNLSSFFNAEPSKAPVDDDYMVIPTISDKPTFGAPPNPDGKIEYIGDSQSPTKFDLITNIKEFTPEIFFDPEEDDQFPESYFTEKEKYKMTNYEVTKIHAENEDYICVNVVEEITAAMLSDVMERFGLCQCEKCKADVMAIALNDLTPKYVGTYKGQLFVKLAGYEKQYATDVLSALTKACIHVKSNPRHETSER